MRLGRLLFIPTVIFLCTVNKSSFAVQFNKSFIIGDASNDNWDMSDKIISEGEYNVDIYVNDQWRGKVGIRINNENNIFIKKGSLPSIGIKLNNNVPKDDEWLNVLSILHGGEKKFIVGELRLNLTLPQAFVIKQDSNWLPPEQWNSGISGLYTNYNLSYINLKNRNVSETQNNISATFTSGLNMNEWHFIDKSYYYRRNDNKSKWVNNSRYMERLFPNIYSSLRVGDSYTESNWFDSVRFRGISLRQETSMYPDSYRTYMPVIRGNASSNAIVKVLQNGNVIYQMTVPAGPFEVNDLMPTGSRSDITVLIENANGQVESFLVPYSTVSDMLRAGSTEWLINAGEYNALTGTNHPRFIQGNYSYGVNNFLTIYSGLIFSNDYYSVLTGGAFSVPHAGSFSVNSEYSNAILNDGKSLYGQKYKISWSKYFPTKTNLTLATYYYSTKDYLSFTNFNNIIQNTQTNNVDSYTRSKQKFNFNLEQRLPDGYGQFSLSGYLLSYWNSESKTKQYSFNWSNTYNQVTWNISIGRTHYDYDSYYYLVKYRNRTYEENFANFSLTIPINALEHSASISTMVSSRNGKYQSFSTGLNGSLPEIDYNLSTSNSKDNNTYSSGYLAWKNPYSRLTGSITASADYTQLGAGASGSILLSRAGVLTSSLTGTNFVIVDAPGITSATVNGNKQIVTNNSGKALVPYATAWRKNIFMINQSNDSDGDILGNVQQVVPWKGSITYLKYMTDTRKIFVIKAKKISGASLPFGALIKDVDNTDLGYVSQGSQLYIKSDKIPESIYIMVNGKRSCRIYDIKSDNINICMPLER